MKILGLDVGEKRIGVATADSAVKIAVPLTTIDVDGTEVAQIKHLLKTEDVRYVVVGLPRNSKGEETAQSAKVRDFADKLKTADAKIKFQDESLTSVTAESRLKKRKKPYQKADVDKEAAAIILQDFIETFTHTDSKDPAQPTSKKGKAKKGKAKHKFVKILLILVGILVVGAVAAVSWYNSNLDPVITNCEIPHDTPPIPTTSKDSCALQEFTIASDESSSSISDRLEKAGLIRNSLAFRIYLRLENKTGLLKAGDYELSPNMAVATIVGIFVSGAKADTFRIMLLPGETIRDTKKRLADQGYPQEEIDAAFAKQYDHPLLATKPEGASLEGYIYGETYEFYATASVEDILTRAFDEMYKLVQEEDLIAKYQARGFTLHQGITLASIIQKEAKPKDMPGVAQVFLLRLQQNIPLGSDVTTTYAADLLKPDRDKTKNCYDIEGLGYTLEKGCLSLKSPYNTRYAGTPPGLTPGPISHPGAYALKSIAEPADSTYLYFLTGDDGIMYYAYTESQHSANAREHCKELCKISL